MELLLVAIGALQAFLAKFIFDENKKTRKELQEIKTRLAWVKKRQLKGGESRESK